MAIFLLVLKSAWGQSGVPQDVSEEEVEDSFLVNPRYRYSFNVVDNDQQVYQDQTQQMEDRVSCRLSKHLDGGGCVGVVVLSWRLEPAWHF